MSHPEAKTGHVNMMVDAVIANLSSEGLRSIMRELLATTPTLTDRFLAQTATFLDARSVDTTPVLFTHSNNGLFEATPALEILQKRARCYMGCGFGMIALQLLAEIVTQAETVVKDVDISKNKTFSDIFVEIDGDIVQGLTAVQKTLHTAHGVREVTQEEERTLKYLRDVCVTVKNVSHEGSLDFPFDRALSALNFMVPFGDSKKSSVNVQEVDQIMNDQLSTGMRGFAPKDPKIENFKLGNTMVPRMFIGLWQSSSPAWGSASASNIRRHFDLYTSRGLTAFDMADHYGDAEVTFGSYRASQSISDPLFCATKWAVFHSITLTEDVVQANIAERCRATQAASIDLLQFHWQDYEDPQYVQALKWLAADSRIDQLGLCNFDTQRLDEIIAAGLNIVSNQVQFSLVDTRPTFNMAESCRKHNIKLLTYGSLCGGFLADCWLGKPTPETFSKGMTPSHRKYLGMINIWGDWTLFQELLATLSHIARKHDCSISNIAVRWVLDHDYVGAVIVGARMGVAEHIEENLKVFDFMLDDEDRTKINEVLMRSRRKDVFKAMGDCGAEYRG